MRTFSAGCPSLWLVRHATPLIEAGVCYGRLDMAADAAATRTAALALAAALPAHIRLVDVSPRLRCRQLADALQQHRPDLQIRTNVRIAEMDFGTWEGQRWDAIGAEAMDQWTADFGSHAVGGGETVDDLLRRVGAAWDEAAATAATDGCDRIWITHAGVARAALLWQAGIRGLSHAHQWPCDGLAFGGWQTVCLSH